MNRFIQILKATLLLFSLMSLPNCKPIGGIFDDTKPPTDPSILINSDGSITSSLFVSLTLSAQTSFEMYITNTADCTSGGEWESYSTSKSWTLSQNNSTATVSAKFRDRSLNETSCYSDTIIHDDIILVWRPPLQRKLSLRLSPILWVKRLRLLYIVIRAAARRYLLRLHFLRVVILKPQPLCPLMPLPLFTPRQLTEFPIAPPAPRWDPIPMISPYRRSH